MNFFAKFEAFRNCGDTVSQVPKELGEPLPEDLFSRWPPSTSPGGGVDAALVSLALAEPLLQRLRLAVELAAADLRSAGDVRFAEEFLRTRDFLKAVSIEVTAAITELGVIIL